MARNPTPLDDRTRRRLRPGRFHSPNRGPCARGNPTAREHCRAEACKEGRVSPAKPVRNLFGRISFRVEAHCVPNTPRRAKTYPVEAGEGVGRDRRSGAIYRHGIYGHGRVKATRRARWLARQHPTDLIYGHNPALLAQPCKIVTKSCRFHAPPRTQAHTFPHISTHSKGSTQFHRIPKIQRTFPKIQRTFPKIQKHPPCRKIRTQTPGQARDHTGASTLNPI